MIIQTKPTTAIAHDTVTQGQKSQRHQQPTTKSVFPPLTPAKKNRLSLTTDKEADAAAHAAVNPRINLLPNADEQREVLGKSLTHSAHKTGLMWPTGPALDHPAAKLLDSYATTGCPVDCGPDWSRSQIEAALRYGAHPSAQATEAKNCLLQETKMKVEEGFAKVVTYKDIKHNLPPKLKLSPIAMIPHKSRKFRAILDLSFTLRATKTKTASVNDTTQKQAPAEAMTELGNVIKRILATIEDRRKADPDIEFMFAKLDIKDGFWRLVVNEADAWNFCYAIPNENADTPIDDTKIVVPNSLQMGWCESPPFFCAASETGRDVIASLLQTDLKHHPFEHKMLPKNFDNIPSHSSHDLTTFATLIEVYVDDYIGAIDNITKEHILQVSRAMLHGIHSVFPPPERHRTQWGGPDFAKETGPTRRTVGLHQRNPGLDYRR